MFTTCSVTICAEPVRRSWIEIDLAALDENIAAVRAALRPGTELIFVVKADAYGHGAVEAARTFAAQGAWGVAVSLVEEGVELREAGIDVPVVVLGGVVPGSQDVIVHRRLTPIVWSREQLEALRGAVGRVGGQPLPVHLVIDTGMSRLGALPRDLGPLLDWFVADRGRSLVLEGVLTHLASADDEGEDPYSARQLSEFSDCLGTIEARGLRPQLRHVSNSATLVRFPGARYDMVRPGIALYGTSVVREVQLPDMRLAMEVASQVLTVRDLPAGTRISYGGHHQLERDARVAVVPMGYADGYPRSMSGQAQMLVRGHRCPVLGNITMDMSILDVTDVPGVQVGEPVVLLGHQEAGSIDAHTLAEWASVIPYEILCGISKRVPRHRR